MIQSSREFKIAFRPRYAKPGGWFAWVQLGSSRRLRWWPINEKAALEWYENARYKKYP